MRELRLPKVGASVADALLGLVVMIAVSWMITADQAGDRPPDVIAYFWAIGLGAMLLVRRTYPLIVLWITVLTLLAYYMWGYPAVGLSIPTAAALLSAAEFRRVRWPVLAALTLLTVSYAVRIAQGQDLIRIVGYELAGEVGLMAAGIALGVSLRLHRELQRSTTQLLEATSRAEQSRASAIIAAERADIARDLHDSLGHQATVISMYVDVARETARQDPAVAQEAVEIIGTTSSEMLAELRDTVKTLRGRYSTRTVTTLAALEPQLIEPMPLNVHAEIDPGLTEHPISPAVQTAIYRIVQEALTNVLRHSAAESATVKITNDSDTVAVVISDEGPALDDAETSQQGAGITGMAERAAALGGWLTARAEATGFFVEAALPLDRKGPS